MKIDKLTIEQERQIPIVRQKWLDYLFSSDATLFNKKVAFEYIDWLYNLCALDKPVKIIVESPFSAQIVANILKKSGGQVREQVWERVREQVLEQVRKQVEEQVGKQVRKQVEEQVGKQVLEQVEEQVGKRVWEQVGKQVRKQEYFDFAYVGVWDYDWISIYDYFDAIGLVGTENFKRHKEFLQTCIYDLIVFRDICIICKKPTRILRDAAYRMHSEHLAAIEWADGYKLHYLYGVYFAPELWSKIVNKEIPAKEILQLTNIEQRRAAIRVYGAESVIKELNAIKIHGETAHGNTLFQLKGLIREEPNEIAKVLAYKCPSTARQYFKFVPSDMADADEAQAWCWSMTKEEYFGCVEES